MKNNILIDFLLNYDKLQKNKRKSKIQDLENFVAKRQGRNPRTVEFNLYPGKMISQEDIDTLKKSGGGCYIREVPHIYQLPF